MTVHAQRGAKSGRSRGQTLALFAVIVPGLLGLMALGMDGAQLFLERRDAQTAADLAALSAVTDLPDDVNAAKTTAKVIGAANGYQQSQIVPVSPYNGDSSQIEVTVNSSVDTFFMPIFSFFVGGDHSSVPVSARAVAEQEQTSSSGAGFAIFALESCPSDEKSVDISGSDSLFVGEVHSNSDVYVSGSNNTINGPTTHVCGSPPFHDGGGGNVFNPAPTSDVDRPDPINLTRSDFTCDHLAPSDGARVAAQIDTDCTTDAARIRDAAKSGASPYDVGTPTVATVGASCAVTVDYTYTPILPFVTSSFTLPIVGQVGPLWDGTLSETMIAQ